MSVLILYLKKSIGYNIKIGAKSSEFVHLLKVKLSLQNDLRWLLLLSWFSKFFLGGPPGPPSRLEVCSLIIFQSNTAQHKPFVYSEAFN